MHTPPFRYALLMNGPTLQTWEEKVLEDLSKLSPSPELVLIIFRKEMEEYSPLKTSWLSRIKKIGFNQLLYYYYHRFFFRSSAQKMLQHSTFLKDIPSLAVETKKIGKWSEHFDAETLKKLKDLNLDFILRFGFNIIRGEILTIPRHGVWSFHHDDEMKYRGGPPGFWEIYNDSPVTGSILQRLTEKLDGGIVLKKGYFKTLKHSYAANLDQVLMESSRWPAHVCKSLNAGTPLPSEVTSTEAPIYRTPNNLQMLFFTLRLFLNYLTGRFSHWFLSEKWDLAILPRPIEEALKPNFLSNPFPLNLSTRKTFFADPFALQNKNGIEILTEKYNYKTGLGSLTSIQFFSKTKKEIPLTGFPEKVHLSFPIFFI